MTEQELREQCKREAESKYPCDMFHATTMGPIRTGPQESAMKAHAEALFQERTKALRLVEAGQYMSAYLDALNEGWAADGESQDQGLDKMIESWDEAAMPYTQTKHPTE